MSNNRFNDHPYLGPKYLKRGIGNYCMNCGRKMGNIRPDLRSANPTWCLTDTNQYAFIGFSHIICPGKGREKESVS
jgi:hypothetical protein